MYDGVELHEFLTTDQFPTIKDAIAAYERNMRKRAAAVARQSLENGEQMHAKGALERMLALLVKND